MNVLYPQHGSGIALASLCEKAGDFHHHILPVLPLQSFLTDDFGRHFKLHQTLLAVFLLPRFMLEHHIQHGNAGGRVAHFAGLGDLCGKGKKIVQSYASAVSSLASSAAPLLLSRLLDFSSFIIGEASVTACLVLMVR